MSKMITRTVPTYTYYVGKFDPATNQMLNIDKFSSHVPIGQRKQASIAKSLGGTVYYTEETSVLMGMTIEEFVKNAQLVEPGTDDTEV